MGYSSPSETDNNSRNGEGGAAPSIHCHISSERVEEQRLG